MRDEFNVRLIIERESNITISVCSNIGRKYLQNETGAPAQFLFLLAYFSEIARIPRVSSRVFNASTIKYLASLSLIES